jgi:thiol-disulfide isomerase/thioredoxin
MAGLLRFRCLPLSPLFLSLATALAPPTASAQEEPAPPSSEELSAVAASLRAHYYDRSWELGVMEGEAWNASAPNAVELRAWYALNLARNGDAEKGIEVAEELVERAPEDPYAWFALAGTLIRDSDRYEEAAEPSAKALALSPDDPDFLSLRADVIRLVDGEEEAIAWVDSLPAEERQHPLVLVRKAVALHALASRSQDREQEEAAFDLFREIVEMDPTFLEAPFFLGSRLQTASRLDEALPLLKRSADLSPSSTVHEYYWRGINARRDLTTEEKKALIEADMDNLQGQAGGNPAALMAMARTYNEWEEDEKRDELYARVLTEYPETVSAEWVLVNQYRELQTELSEQQRDAGEQDPELKARYRRRLEEFLMRPVFHQETLRGDAYRSLLYLVQEEEDVDPELLYSVVRGVELYEGINIHIIYALAPTVLADHDAHLDYAEELVRKGFTAAEEEIEEYRERGVFDSEEEAQQSADYFRSTMLDALGWVHFKQGLLDDAEGELLQAFELSKMNVTAPLHLGRLYERRHTLALETDGDEELAEGYLDQAQDFYLKGSLVARPGENPNDEALETLYEKRHGSLEGFEAYVAEASSRDATDRKAEILEDRLEEPKTFPAFSLEDLSGDTVSSDELAGKVVVINFWGTWCGPCVIEMPGIQEFYDQHKDDPGVVFLTIANDTNPDLVHRFMAEHEYSFPVLLDDGFVRDAGVRAFPTSWFIDARGQIWFEKQGWSEELAQEFAWRVEALRSVS